MEKQRYDITDGVSRIEWNDAKIDYPKKVGGLTDGLEVTVDFLAEALRSLTVAVCRYMIEEPEAGQQMYEYDKKCTAEDSVIANLMAATFALSEIGYSNHGTGNEFLKELGIV